MAPPFQIEEKQMQSAFGVDHGEVSKAFGMPKLGAGIRNFGAGGGTQRAVNRGFSTAERAGQGIKRNLKPLAVGGAAGLGGYGLGRNKNNKPRSA